MPWDTLIFFILSAVAILTALGMVASANPVHSAIFLILCFFNVAGIFVMLGAEFLAAVQVIVYAGAILVLVLFVLMLGYLHAFGQQYSANRSQDISPAYELTEGRGGTRRVQTTGPARRAVEIAWDDGVDASRLAATNDDYLEAHVGTGAIASPADVVPSMLGLMAQLDGAATPVVYLPQVPVLSGGTTVAHIVAPPLMLYGRIRTETLRMDTIQGNEYENPGEVYRLARVRMEEEL